MTNSILIFILLLLLIVGIIFIATIVVLNQRDAIRKILDDNSKNSNDINMRLIAFLTETILSTDALEQRDVDNFRLDLEANDLQKLEKIKEEIIGPPSNVEPAFDPFEEVFDNSADVINDNSSVINK